MKRSSRPCSRIAANMKFADIPQFTRAASYRVNVGWDYLRDWLAHNEPDQDLDPDFQRGHVWNTEKRRRYVEYILRGGQSSRDIYFNHPNWMGSYEGTLELVDGKQRMTAVLLFLENKLAIFGGNKIKDFTDKMRISGPDFVVHVNSLKTRAEVLQWYLDLNDGGVVHTKSELDKVRALLAAEKK